MTRTYTLEQVNEAYNDALQGRPFRGVIEFKKQAMEEMTTIVAQENPRGIFCEATDHSTKGAYT